MNLYLLLLHLAGGVTLLLWAVRMVRTGVERSQEPRLKRLLRGSKGGRLRAAGIGAGVAVLLQSSTAVAVLAAGFAGSGVLPLATGLALMLGADLGSAIVAQLLSIDVHWIVPVLMLAGGLLFFRGPSRDWRQGGRVLIGIALVLISLQMISEATAPLRAAELLPEIVGYLRGDFVTTFLLGAAFTWLVHSSVASILLIATFAAQGVVPLELIGSGAARQVLNLHLLFNLALVLVCL
ncbi:MAG TPA: Na/Pi cotransporter family protein, partial [Alphaproteobacteria bacterium]|nr:Na/Pi cotransporter family protein [Alphaproteobacteria bacterium]